MGTEVPLGHPPDAGGNDHVDARATGDGGNQVDVPTEIDGGQVDDRPDASAVEVGHLPVGNREDGVTVEQVGPVLVHAG